MSSSWLNSWLRSWGRSWGFTQTPTPTPTPTDEGGGGLFLSAEYERKKQQATLDEAIRQVSVREERTEAEKEKERRQKSLQAEVRNQQIGKIVDLLTEQREMIERIKREEIALFILLSEPFA